MTSEDGTGTECLPADYFLGEEASVGSRIASREWTVILYSVSVFLWRVLMTLLDRT